MYKFLFVKCVDVVIYCAFKQVNCEVIFNYVIRQLYRLNETDKIQDFLAQQMQRMLVVLSVVKPVSKQVFKLLEFDYRTKIVSSQIIFNK